MIFLFASSLIIVIIVGAVFFYLKMHLLKLWIVYACISGVGSTVLSGMIYAGGYFSAAYYSEIWNYKAKNVTYYEAWTEQVTTTYTDDKGNVHTSVSYHYHPPYWVATTEADDEQQISKDAYKQWMSIWKNEKEVNVWHVNQSSFGDGNKFVSTWPGNFETMLPLSEIHSYENKIRATDNIWSQTGTLNKELVKKFPRPADVKNVDAIISHDFKIKADEQLHLRRLNAVFGPKHEIHTIVYLLNANTYVDASTARDIVTSWNGPNKNELVSFVGIDSKRNVKWAEVFSWMDDTTLHSIIRQDLNGLGQWNVYKYGEILQNRVPQYWKRKQFADFDYISVDLPGWTTFVNILTSLVVAIGSCLYLAKQKT